MKKKILVVTLALAVALGLTACNSGSSSEESSAANESNAASSSSGEEAASSSSESNATSSSSEENAAADSGNNSAASSSTTQEASGETEFSEDQLDIEAVPTEEGPLAVFITNNSDVIIQELEVQVNFKDESGATVDLDSDGHDVVLPGSTVVSRMDAPDSYADYEIETDIDLDDHPYYENYAADVEINSNLGDDCIIIEITNNADVTIEEIEYDVVLYKDGNIVKIERPNDVYDVESGQTVTEKENTRSDEFDDYEIYLNQAHVFNL